MDLHEDIVDVLLRYGLFIGAVFQLVCIGAVIVMPDSKTESGLNDSASEDEPSASDRENSSPQISPNHKHYRAKRDKKKRR